MAFLEGGCFAFRRLRTPKEMGSLAVERQGGVILASVFMLCIWRR